MLIICCAMLALGTSSAPAMEPNTTNINSIPGGPGGYDGRRMAPAGGYTQAPAEGAAGVSSQRLPHPADPVMAAACQAPMGQMQMQMQGQQQAMPPHPGAAFASAGGWSGTSSFSAGFSAASGGGAVPVSPPAGASSSPFANPSSMSPHAQQQSPFSAVPTPTRSFSVPTSSFGSYASCADNGTSAAGGGGSGRKRKCSGDGVETCGSCGHRLMMQRLTSDGTAPEVAGYCNSCVCRCALCGQPVLRTACAETIMDEPLVMTARRLGIPLEDSFAMGQDIGLHCRVCADGCMKKLNRMRRMQKRRSSSGLLATNNNDNTSAAAADSMDMS